MAAPLNLKPYHPFIGDKVDHQILTRENCCTEGEVAVIAFSAEHGIKKIILGHPSLKKVNKFMPTIK